jgi:hypothetical protein
MKQCGNMRPAVGDAVMDLMQRCNQSFLNEPPDQQYAEERKKTGRDINISEPVYRRPERVARNRRYQISSGSGSVSPLSHSKAAPITVRIAAESEGYGQVRIRSCRNIPGSNGDNARP